MAQRPDGGITVAHVKEIPIRLHWTFLLALPLFAYLIGRAYFSPAPGVAPTTLGWVYGAALAAFLFASVLLHELGHSLVALRRGTAIRSITLLPIGGVSAMEDTPRDPTSEFRITIAGPLVNFAIGIPLYALALANLVPNVLPGFARFVALAGLLNLVLGAFNLFVPAFPMDGGRILRSLLARRMRLERATSIAATIGRGFAFLLGVWGFLTFTSGGWLPLLIAFFIWAGAGEEERATRITAALEDRPVAALMTRHVDTLTPRDTVESAFDAMLATKHLALPVVEETGQVVGVVHLQDLAVARKQRGPEASVGEIAHVDFPTLSPDAPATQALKLSRDKGPEPILVMDAANHLAGIVTQTDLLRTVQILQAERDVA